MRWLSRSSLVLVRLEGPSIVFYSMKIHVAVNTLSQRPVHRLDAFAGINRCHSKRICMEPWDPACCVRCRSEAHSDPQELPAAWPHHASSACRWGSTAHLTYWGCIKNHEQECCLDCHRHRDLVRWDSSFWPCQQRTVKASTWWTDWESDLRAIGCAGTSSHGHTKCTGVNKASTDAQKPQRASCKPPLTRKKSR